MADPISELMEKFDESIVHRGLKRQQNDSVERLGPERWHVEGDEKLNDAQDVYTLEFDGGVYRCDCYDNNYGNVRQKNVCSHAIAVMIDRRLEKLEEEYSDDAEDDSWREGVSDLIDRVWPHMDGDDPYRGGTQKDVMLDAIEKLFVDGYDYYTVSAPTGFGKSPVCYTLSFVVGLLQRESSRDDTLAERVEGAHDAMERGMTAGLGYSVTPQNILLDQVDDDYGDLDRFGLVKGRSHYSCSEGCGSCSNGPCRFDKDKDCDSYAPARDAAIGSPVTNTNFSMFMVHPKIEKRPCLVVDEAHMASEYVLGQVEVKLREDRIGDMGWDLPSEYDEFSEYVNWMEPKAHALESELSKLNNELERQSARGDPDVSLVKKYERVERLKSKLDRLIRDWRSVEEPWVVQHEEEWDDRKEEYINTVQFRPITPYRFMDDLVFSKGEKTIISSATPPEPEILGLDPDEVYTEEVESPFPVENRPCYVDTVGKMSSSSRDQNLPDVIDKIQNLAVGKTFIHAHTYDYRKKIGRKLMEIYGEDEVMIQDSGRREESLYEWQNSDAQFFVSVNMYDGVDLKDDLCRTNIICMCPFPYLGDPQIQKRKEVEGDRFFNWRTAMRMMQGYGRSTRHDEDWSNTYILDDNFKWFYKQNEDLFFDWFTEAVEIV